MESPLIRQPDRPLSRHGVASGVSGLHQRRRQPCRVHASSEARRPQLKPRGPSTAEGSDNGVAVAESAAPSQRPGTTVEYQRQQAKELQRYFRGLKEEGIAERQKLFGWTSRAEIQNGRWVMFGLMVGLLTEYATGVSFVNQIKLMVSYLGIADIYD